MEGRSRQGDTVRGVTAHLQNGKPFGAPGVSAEGCEELRGKAGPEGGVRAPKGRKTKAE